MAVFEDEGEPAPVGFASFPKAMGAFYLTFYLSDGCVSWESGDLKYTVEGDVGILRIAKKKLELKATRAFHFTELPLQADELFRLMPDDAAKFAFVYPASSFAIGGFVYLNDTGEAIAVCQLSTDVTDVAFRMGEKQEMPLDVANELKHLSEDVTLDLNGARRFCFVGPGQVPVFQGNTLGGFAYWCDDDKEHCFFPILGYSVVVERGPSSMVGSAMLFPRRPSSSEVCKGIVDKKASGSSSRTSLKDLSEQVVINVIKFKQNGLTHPIVLRSVLLTSNEKSLKSVHIQAIVSAAFRECSSHLIAEVVTNILFWLSITIFTRRFRYLSNSDWGLNSGTDSDTVEWFLFALIVVTWLINFGRLLLGVRGHRITFGSFEHYWLRRNRLLVWWLATGLQLGTMVQLWIGGQSTISRSVASMSLAACGTLFWVQMLFLTSPFTAIGERFLPIVKACGEIGSFGLVTAFLFLASAQASYALTELDGWAILFYTYSMSIGIDMQPDLFIGPGLSLDLDPDSIRNMDPMEGSRVGFGYFLLCGFSFVLMVSMANIFIQVMGDAYNRKKDEVQVTLTRARAEECLIATLWMSGGAPLLPRLCGRSRRKDFVWFTQGDGQSQEAFGEEDRESEPKAPRPGDQESKPEGPRPQDQESRPVSSGARPPPPPLADPSPYASLLLRQSDLSRWALPGGIESAAVPRR